MDSASIKREKEEIIKKFGPWTGHNLRLADGLYTIDERIIGDEIKLRRVVQIVADAADRPLKELRVLDLACLEGLYAVELARRGAKAVGIEGREANIEKARFAKKVFELNNLELILDDVRNLSREKHGTFDLVLCLGILYHLDVPDVFHFLERVAEVCQGIAVIDTHISLSPRRGVVYKSNKYWGKDFREHSPRASLEKRKKALWASLDNVNSFWPTRDSLLALLSDVGFTSVYECQIPPEQNKPRDRLTLLAIKGDRQQLVSNPLVNDLPLVQRQEKRGLFSRG